MVFFDVVTAQQTYPTKSFTPSFEEGTYRQQLTFVSNGRMVTLDQSAVLHINYRPVQMPKRCTCGCGE